MNVILTRKILDCLEEIDAPFSALFMREYLISKYGTKTVGSTRTISSILKRHCEQLPDGLWRYRNGSNKSE
jgi:hypothetical protein